MAREIVWRCDGCGEYADPDNLNEVLFRAASATSVNFAKSIQLCGKCQEDTSVAAAIARADEVAQ